MAQHRITRGPIDPEPTIQDVLDEVDRVDRKLSQALNELNEIKLALERVSSSIAEVQSSVNQKDF
jgi:hypothetical protein